MESDHTNAVYAALDKCGLFGTGINVITLGIPDNYEYRNPVLIDMIKNQYIRHNKEYAQP
jgi:predicted protein tyrosine phosphatase